MFSELDPLMDFGCPHCSASLRFRRVSKLPGGDARGGNSPRVCAHCSGLIVERRHPAIADNWRWSRFYLPGVLLCAAGIFVPSLGWLLPFALVVLAIGLAALVAYMVRERWGWNRYAAYREDDSRPCATR